MRYKKHAERMRRRRFYIRQAPRFISKFFNEPLPTIKNGKEVIHTNGERSRLKFNKSCGHYSVIWVSY